jgi:hypothetical protein
MRRTVLLGHVAINEGEAPVSPPAQSNGGPAPTHECVMVGRAMLVQPIDKA